VLDNLCFLRPLDEDIDIFCTKPGSTTRSRVACLKGLWDFVTDLAVSQDRRKLVSCSAAPIVRIWENESCAPATASKNSSPTNCWVEKHNYGFFEDQYDRIIRAVAILPNGEMIVCLSFKVEHSRSLLFLTLNRRFSLFVRTRF
jgi:WD40 repeat protein